MALPLDGYRRDMSPLAGLLVSISPRLVSLLGGPPTPTYNERWLACDFLTYCKSAIKGSIASRIDEVGDPLPTTALLVMVSEPARSTSGSSHISIWKFED